MYRSVAMLLLFAPITLGDDAATVGKRPRLLILTDIGGDPDDQQSMRRLMLYANEFEIVGLIASASGTPREVGKAVVRPELILEIVDDYAAVVANLRLHGEGYPDPAALRSVIKAGSPERGVPHLGEGRSTAGSRHIIEAVDASERPLYVAIWGGAHDLAQALFDVRAGREEAETAAFVARLRVYAIADQDAWGPDGKGTGQWIRDHFPRLRYVESGPPGMDRYAALFRGMYQNDSAGGGKPLPLVTDEVAALNDEAWVVRHVRRDHGPLGAGYPIVNQNPNTDRNTRGVKEGDTPSWFFVLPNGLHDPDRPDLGGWGGRFRPESGGHFTDAEDDHPSGLDDPALRRKWTVARWRRAYQNDFAARLQWCVKPFGEANHNPVAVVDGDETPEILRRSASPGERIRLDASGSSDPDGDDLLFRWYVYPQTAELPEGKVIEGEDSPLATIEIPANSTASVIPIVLEVEDSGSPPLVSYRRVLIEIGRNR
ncbi:hypothetical protein BH23PLA1_BH23PLA1_04110 [soil metagenome]